MDTGKALSLIFELLPLVDGTQEELAYDTLKNALKRNEPMLVSALQHCPACDTSVCGEFDDEPEYCPWCGQRIYWNESDFWPECGEPESLTDTMRDSIH